MSGVIISASTGGKSLSPSLITGLQLWLDAANAASITISSGTSISQWIDLSGNANHALQPTSARQPTLTGALNGLNTINFLESSLQYFNLTNPITISGANYTTFVVWKRVSDNIFSLGNSSSNSLTLDWEFDGTSYISDGSANIYVTSTLNTDTTNYYCYIAIAGGSLGNDYVYRSGVDATNRSNTGAYSATTVDRVGFNFPNGSNGYIAELAFYNRAITASEVSSLSNYSKKKWGV